MKNIIHALFILGSLNVQILEKRFKTTIVKHDNNLWGFYLDVPIEIGKSFIDAKAKRVLCSVNGLDQFHAAIMPMHGGYFININKDLRKKISLDSNAQVDVHIKKDTSKYGMPVAEEFAEVIFEDPEADDIFQALTPGKQRSLLYLVYKVKSTDKRIEKALVIAHHLKITNGKIDYKELNNAFKHKIIGF